MSEPRRVLLAGDWHGDTNYARHCLARFGDQADAVVHLGDFGFTFTPGFVREIEVPSGGSGWPEADEHASNIYRHQLADLARAVWPRFIWHGHWHRRTTSTIDLDGRDCRIAGLDCNGTPFSDNTDLIDLDELETRP